MLSHFHKLNTQLKSVSTYPNVTDQHTRFSSRGWASVKVWTLWQAWADETFLSASERRALDEIEQFDEWEEFALFASHYCVVHARVGGSVVAVPAPSIPSGTGMPVQSAALQFDECPGVRGQRRFAAAMRASQDRAQQSVLNVLGLGTKSRLQSCDLFSAGAAESEASLTFREGGPATRMCHSLTELGTNSALLAGGRGSPSSPLKDCWLYDQGLKAWTQTHDLPFPLYRHSVTALGESGLAMLVGGRGATEAYDGCLLFHPEAGWVNCEIQGDKPAAVYGAVLSCGAGNTASFFKGIYVGGLQDGLISNQILLWEADVSDIQVWACLCHLTVEPGLTSAQKPTVKFTPLEVSGNVEEDSSRWLLTRFGATCLKHGDEFIVFGGVAKDHLLRHQDEVILCSVSNGELNITRRLSNQATGNGEPAPRPLFVGHSAVSMPDGSVVVVGGGATCFSMGTFWNKGVYNLRVLASGGEEASQIPPPAPRWVHEKSVDISPVQRSAPTVTKHQKGGELASIRTIPRLKLESANDFLKVVRDGQPVVLEGLDLGSCVSAWTLDYLVDKVGADRKVVVHEAATQAMDFTAKNFRYVTTEFGEFAQRVGQGDKVYLRALSHERPSEKPAVLAEDFPALAPDFVLPAQLSLVAENLFSSVLRMSGRVNMWLHYDVSWLRLPCLFLLFS